MTSASLAATTMTPLIAQLTSGTAYYVGLTLLVIMMFVALIKAFRVWEEINDVEEPDAPGDLLESFEQAHAEGDLDDHELDRVRQLLAAGERKAEVPATKGRSSAPAPPIVEAREHHPHTGDGPAPDAP